MQMHLISAVHISHHYAALGELQLIPAYYPSAKSFCLISSSLAAAEEKQSCPSVEAHLTYNPRCYEDSNHLGLINFNRVGTIKPQNNGDFLLHLHVPSKSQHERMNKGRNQDWCFSFLLGGRGRVDMRVKKSNKNRTNIYTKTCPLPAAISIPILIYMDM